MTRSNFFNERSFLMSKPEVMIRSSNNAKFNCDLFLKVILSVSSNVGQAVFLPLFISTFAKASCQNGIATGAYFILFIMSFLFNFPFLIGCVRDYYYGDLKIEHLKTFIFPIILMGIFDALNGLLMVFSSSLDRTSGYMQSILINLNIPLTVIISRIFLLNEPYTDVKSIIIITIGIFISILPNLIKISSSTEQLSFIEIVYPCVFALSVVPNVLMNIIQKHIFMQCPNFNKNLMLFGESIFQFLTIGLCFWFDLLPYIGTSTNFDEFKNNFIYGSQCFFFPMFHSDLVSINLCRYSMLIGLAFALSYYGVYYYNSHLIDQVSVGFNSIIQIVSTPIQIFIWFVFAPSLTWACITTHSTFQMAMAFIALPFIMYGSWLYYKNVEKSKNAYVVVNSVIDV